MNRKRISVVLGAVVAAVGLTAFGALAAGGGSGIPAGVADVGTEAVAGSCTFGKLSFISSDGSFTTTANAMADLPDSTIQFKLGGKAPGCVKVEFTAQTLTTQDEALVIQALLDDSRLGAPGTVIFDGDADEDGDFMWVRSHSTTFVFTNVAPGNHRVKIQYRGTFGGTVTVFKPMTLVEHR